MSYIAGPIFSLPCVTGVKEELAIRPHPKLRGHGGLTARGSYLDVSLCNKNSDLNFQKFLLENEVGGTYYLFQDFTRKGRVPSYLESF